MKATTTEMDLHSSVKQKDDLALSKLYDLYGDSIVKSLKRWFPKIAIKDESFILEAINEAFFGYYKNPDTFNPQINSLNRFLEVAAERDLINILNREKKHSNRQDLPDNVELQENFWNRWVENKGWTDGEIIERETIALINIELQAHFSDNSDVIMAKMVLSGERDTSEFSSILDIEHLPIESQREEVKKHKDRIKKVLERNQVELKIKNLIR